MPFNPTFVVVNTAGVQQSIVDQWQALTTYALNLWGAVLAGSASPVVRIEILPTTPSGRAQGGPASVIATNGGPDGAVTFEGTAAWELRHGSNPNGSDADILIQVASPYLLTELFLDPTPETANDIPANRTDALSVLVHELGHALGFTGYYTEATNSFPGGSHSPYDWRLGLQLGEVFFDGPNVRALTGGAIELTDNNFAHYGNSNAHPSGGDLLTGLMNGVVFYRGWRYEIGDLDLAFLADLGLGTIRDDVFDNIWLEVIRGGPGVDTFIGDYSSVLTSLDFDAGSAVFTLGDLTLHEIERLELSLGQASDVVIGTSGADVLNANGGSDTLIGGVGADAINGGDGVDTASYESSSAAVYVSLAASAGYSGDALNDSLISIENLIGSNHNDTLVGDAGANALSGESGVDILYGQDGADTLVGGEGADQLWGEAGADSMSGGDGDDTIFADSADTLVAGNAGFDYVYFTGAGNFVVDAGAGGVEWIYSSDGNDTLNAATQTAGVVFYGLGGADQMTGGAAIDTLYGGEGNDTLVGGALGDALWGEGGADSISGGLGDDTLICDVLDTLVSGGAGYDYVYFTGAGNFVIDAGAAGLEWIFANEGNDGLNAASQSQGVIYYGLGGADALTGGAGIDTLFGGEGNDTLVGGALGDSLWGEGGADSISGGDGDDTIFADSLDTLVSGGAGQDFLYILGDSDFVIDAGANGIEWMLSGGGNDTLNAASQSANVVAYGGAGNDTISGGSGTDVLFGQGGADDIHGGGNGDVLLGEAGADTLNGGLGNDLMFGGADADTFAFEASWGFDTVGDFENGSDLFDMTALAGEGVNDFGDLTIGTSGADALISWNGNFITVSNAAGVIDASDFLFG